MTPLPAHPPEFYRFNQQAPIRHNLPPGSNQPPPPSMRSPFYPSNSLTPDQQQQMFIQV